LINCWKEIPFDLTSEIYNFMLELHEKRESENLFPTFNSKSWKVFKKCNPRTKNRKRLIITQHPKNARK